MTVKNDAALYEVSLLFFSQAKPEIATNLFITFTAISTQTHFYCVILPLELEAYQSLENVI